MPSPAPAETELSPPAETSKAPKAYCPGCGADRRITAKGVFWDHARDGKKRVTEANRCPYSGKTGGGAIPSEPAAESPLTYEEEVAIKSGGVPSDEGLELLQQRAAADPPEAKKACTCGTTAGDDAACPQHGAEPRREPAREATLLGDATAAPGGEGAEFQARATGQVSLTGETPQVSIVERGRVLRESAYFETLNFKLTVPLDDLELAQTMTEGSADARLLLLRRVRPKNKATRLGTEAYAAETAKLLEEAFSCDPKSLPLKGE